MKIRRHNKILDIIKDNEISKQEELKERLKEEGFDVTQATLSRDINELCIVKIHKNGKYVYGTMPLDNTQQRTRFINYFKGTFVDMSHSGNIVIVKTIVGMAIGVSTAIESLNFEEAMGCVAGYDTIMIVTKGEEDSINLIKKIEEILRG